MNMVNYPGRERRLSFTKSQMERGFCQDPGMVRAARAQASRSVSLLFRARASGQSEPDQRQQSPSRRSSISQAPKKTWSPTVSGLGITCRRSPLLFKERTRPEEWRKLQAALGAEPGRAGRDGPLELYSHPEVDYWVYREYHTVLKHHILFAPGWL